VRDDALERLLEYHGIRYYLANAWYVRFRVWRVEVTETRPYGIRYSFTLHGDLNERLLGFDNAHGVPRQVAHDHQHAFRRTKDVSAYEFVNADRLLSDFFATVEAACQQENIEFTFVEKEVELDVEAGEGADDED
jgi:Family of unknown function (DUF6516)